ncbi:MAG TPA: outer membrane protein assembly factor BamB [Casimicrobiaceae bacterium]|nr:outer membrane protein assembly factor BamB [Casimicrobiaceae bacterium]
MPNKRDAHRRERVRTTSAWLSIALAASLLAGCGTINSVLPSVSWPSWLGGSDSKKLGALPDIRATVTPKVLWQASIGKAQPGLAPAVTTDAVYVASLDGNLARIELGTGRMEWRRNVGKSLTAGVGADADTVAVGTDKGDVLAFKTTGQPLWQVRVSSEVTAPPVIGNNVVAVFSGDGRIYGLNVADGSTKWVHQRTNPPLMVRNATGGVLSRGGLFSGSAGGKLLALDIGTGTVGWESSVATPKGATELERIADVTSLPVVEDREACAVAFQGRIACFEVARGVLQWSRDISSLTGIAADDKYYYVVDDRGSIHALDKATGASVWKQDRLAKRRLGGPQIVGEYLGVVDGEGYLHLLDRAEGNLVGRLATDGTPATTQPTRAGNLAIWQSEGGNVYAVTAP